MDETLDMVGKYARALGRAEATIEMAIEKLALESMTPLQLEEWLKARLADVRKEYQG